MTRKIIVIGLDGVSLNFIKPWIEKNKLPTFKELMKRGCYGELRSTIPPVTVPAWASMFTGLNPGKLGAFEFGVKREGSYDFSIFNSTFWKGKAIWDIAKNKKSIIINVPSTYPPWKINGIMISGMLTPSKKRFTYPEKIKKELKSYIIEPEAKEKEAYDAFKKRFNVFDKFLEKKFDLFVIVFRYPDVTSHIKKKDWKERYYFCIKRIDESIGKMMKRLEKYDVFITSDHGISIFEKCFFINKWLTDNGYLTLKKQPLKKMVLKKMSQMVREFLDRYKLWGLREFFLKILEKRVEVSTPFDKNFVIWNKTKAFSIGGGAYPFAAIYINRKNTFPNGIVNEGEYEVLRKKIIKKLLELKKDGIIKDVWKKEEIYNGERIKMLPDIIVQTSREYYVHPDHFSTMLTASHKDIPHHTMDGIFMAFGPDIKRGKIVEGAGVIDIAPTILYMLGLPIPNDMDGRILKEILKKGDYKPTAP